MVDIIVKCLHCRLYKLHFIGEIKSEMKPFHCKKIFQCKHFIFYNIIIYITSESTVKMDSKNLVA